MTEDKGLRERVTRQGEEAIGKLAQELLENPVVSGALSRGVRDARARGSGPGSRDGGPQPALGERPRAAHAATARRLAAARGDRGRARPGRAADRRRRRTPRSTSGWPRSRSSSTRSRRRSRDSRRRRRSALGRRPRGRAPAPRTSPSRCSASRSASSSIRRRLGRSTSETISRLAASSLVPGGEREQRRRLHLDRDRAVGEPGLLDVRSRVVEQIG